MRILRSRRAKGESYFMTVRKPSAILFDMDGVLVRSHEAWFRTLEEAGRRFRGRAVTRAEFDPTFGQGTRADVAQFELDCMPEELDRFYVEVFPKYAESVWTDPDAAETLSSIARRGVALALVTNTVSDLARIILKSARLEEHFPVIACADNVAHPKPAPDLLLHALQRLGVAAGEAWMVGDSRYDREAARAAGVTFVGYGIDGDWRADRLKEIQSLVLGP
jgi:HAD superfamily hydrolase (TIGR01549 family)